MHWQCSLLSLNKEFHLLLLLCTKLKRQPFHTLSHLHLLSIHLFWDFLIQLFGLLLHFCSSYLEELFSCANVFLIVQISVSYFSRHFPFFDAFSLFFSFFPLFFLFCLHNSCMPFEKLQSHYLHWSMSIKKLNRQTEQSSKDNIHSRVIFLVLTNMTIYRKPENWPIYLFLRNLQIDYTIRFWMGDWVAGLTTALVSYSLNYGHVKVLYLLTWIDRHSKQQSFKKRLPWKTFFNFLQSACVNRRLPKATQSYVAYFGSFHICQ